VNNRKPTNMGIIYGVADRVSERVYTRDAYDAITYQVYNNMHGYLRLGPVGNIDLGSFL